MATHLQSESNSASGASLFQQSIRDRISPIWEPLSCFACCIHEARCDCDSDFNCSSGWHDPVAKLMDWSVYTRIGLDGERSDRCIRGDYGEEMIASRIRLGWIVSE
jgi:hypothetical protein